jgi:hypothetical protein
VVSDTLTVNSTVLVGDTILFAYGERNFGVVEDEVPKSKSSGIAVFQQ